MSNISNCTVSDVSIPCVDRQAVSVVSASRSVCRLHGLEYLKDAVELERHGPVASLTHRLLRDDTRVDVRLQVCYLLLHVDCVLYDLLLGLLGLDTNFEDLVDDFFEVLDHVIVLGLEVLVRLIDDADKDLAIVLQRSPQCLQIVIHKLGELVNSVIQCCEVSEDRLGESIFELLELGERPGLRCLHHLVKLGPVNGQV